MITIVNAIAIAPMVNSGYLVAFFSFARLSCMFCMISDSLVIDSPSVPVCSPRLTIDTERFPS